MTEEEKKIFHYVEKQLLEAREIICSMVSEWKKKNKISYSTQKRGEDLLKKWVYSKN